MTSSASRIRRSATACAVAVGLGAVAGHLLDPASGAARRNVVRERILGLVPGSIRGTSRDDVVPGPPIGGQDSEHEGQGDPTGGATFVQLCENV